MFVAAGSGAIVVACAAYGATGGGMNCCGDATSGVVTLVVVECGEEDDVFAGVSSFDHDCGNDVGGGAPGTNPFCAPSAESGG